MTGHTAQQEVDKAEKTVGHPARPAPESGIRKNQSGGQPYTGNPFLLGYSRHICLIPYSMKITLLRPLAAVLLLTGSLTACNTGNENGATNVELGDNKSLDPSARRPDNQGADSATSGLQPDTGRITIEQQYKNAADAPDRNRDGLVD